VERSGEVERAGGIERLVVRRLARGEADAGHEECHRTGTHGEMVSALAGDRWSV
jgi:hypothetical protein